MDGKTIESLADMICGDGEYPVYRSGPELTRFFHRVGFPNFTHDGSTRKWWTLDVLTQLTENNLTAAVLRLADPREYGGSQQQVSQAITRLNEIIMVEGLKVELDGAKPSIKEITPQLAEKSEEPDLMPLPLVMIKSTSSFITLVIPQEIFWLNPIIISGLPGIVKPATFTPGATKCAMYQRDGFIRVKCGSFAKIGLPDFDFDPEITQLLLPWPSPTLPVMLAIWS